jgi:RNA polymerase sigma-70 factor, ECF subfamily
MSSTALEVLNGTEALSDQEIVRRVLGGETALFELIMRRYNQRLYRVARAILRDDAEAEDVMQDAYVRAYEHLNQFAGRSQFATWLTRIAIHEALARAQRRKRTEQLGTNAWTEAGIDREVDVAASALNPEEQVSVAELGRALEDAILSIPEHYRLVLMMRDVEQLSTTETAAALDLSEENVKVRLHRARAMVRKNLFVQAGSEAPRAFGFMGERCDRVVAKVMAKICAAGK